jgi:hypothetical protein
MSSLAMLQIKFVLALRIEFRALHMLGTLQLSYIPKCKALFKEVNFSSSLSNQTI